MIERSCIRCEAVFTVPYQSVRKRYCTKSCAARARGDRAREPIAEALLERIEISPQGCWPWTGTLTKPGYGHLNTTEVMATGRTRLAHRLSYEEFVGPIPEGLELDHLCHDPRVCWEGDNCQHRRCINPAHLAPMTGVENSLRTNHTVRTHCKHNHEFTPENTFDNHGRRGCRTCAVRRTRERRARLAKESS